MATKRSKPAKKTRQVKGKKPVAGIRPAATVVWDEPPEHYGGAYSKMLVRPESSGSTNIDYRISVYQPRAYVEPHHHKIQEQVYHVLEGEGLMELDGKRNVVRKDDIIFIPPGTRHAIYNTGMTDLKFVVVTSPADE